MRTGMRIGRVFGVELAIDWSWILVFLLITFNLSAAFSRAHPNWPPYSDLVVAGTAAILFFASVLFHELAHSLVARMYGIPVHSITLFLFGGISNIQREPQSPGVEFLMAIAGPIASVVAGALLLGFGGLVGGSAFSAPYASDPASLVVALGPISTLLLWAGSASLVVGLFNLIPAFPLDGGRVLRAAIWKGTGNFRLATRIAAVVGQVTGWLFIFFGILMSFGAWIPFFGTGFASGLWIAFIGWFLRAAAAQSYERVVLHELLEGLVVGHFMRPVGLVVPPTLPVRRLVDEWLMTHQDPAYLVMDGEQLLGIVSLRDVRATPREDWDRATAADIMTPREKIVTVSLTEPVVDVLTKLGRAGISQLPVVDGGRVLGMVYERDIARWIELQSETQHPSRHSYAT